MVLFMFVVGLLDENGIIVDMLEVHDLNVKDLNLAKISWIPRLYEQSRMRLGQLCRPIKCMTSVNMLVCWSGVKVWF